MGTSAQTNVEALLTKVRAIEPIIRKHAPESEQKRRLSTPVVEAMRDAGLYRLWRPKSRGGLELDPVSGFQIFEEVARIDGATGWNLQLANGGEIFAAWFADDATKEIYQSQDTIVAGAFNPPRHAVITKGGYRVSGRTGFNSGCHHATWSLGLAHIYDGDTLRTDDAGEPVTIMTFAPARDVQIIENWDTLGLCGTGSHDAVMENVFVPEAMTALLAPLETPGDAYKGPMHRLSIWPGVCCLATPALGIARAAIDDLIQLATRKTPAYTLKTMRDRSVVQLQLAQAEVRLEAARAYLHTVFDDAWPDALNGIKAEMPQRCKFQLAGTNAALAAAEAVDIVHTAVGASGIRNEYNFQKYFRNVHVNTQHAFICQSRYESVGQAMLGLEPEWSFFKF